MVLHTQMVHPQGISFLLLLIILVVGILGCADARFKVESTPSGAAVFVNDSAVGNTPWVGNISPGKRTVKIEEHGYLIFSDTFTLQAHWKRNYLAPIFMLGGLSSGIWGISQNNLSIEILGLGIHLVGLGIAAYPDTLLQVKLQKGDSLTEKTLVQEKRKMYPVGMQRFQLPEAKKLSVTDSVCWDQKQRTLWIFDNQKQLQRPFAIDAVQRCDDQSGTSSTRPHFWKFWAAATAISFGIFSTVGYHTAEETLGWLSISALVGATFAWIPWLMIPDNEICERQSDPLATQQWMLQYPCYP